ncbi:MAG: nitroreductase family protein [Desulfobulbaceae bacterium]|nr:nitroreductase family protein [Desulfobulbaceae bacterium]
MNQIMAAMTKRRSIRRYTSDPVPEEVLADILRAVQCSPSWANTQCWEIVVIRDRNVKEQLQGVLSPKNPAAIAMTSAPVVLAVCGRVKTSGYYKGTAVTGLGDWMLFDLGLVTQNILLAATSYNLGTVVVGAFDHDMAGSFLRLPQDVKAAVLIPLGYPDHSPGPTGRRAVDEFVHHNTY